MSDELGGKRPESRQEQEPNELSFTKQAEAIERQYERDIDTDIEQLRDKYRILVISCISQSGDNIAFSESKEGGEDIPWFADALKDTLDEDRDSLTFVRPGWGDPLPPRDEFSHIIIGGGTHATIEDQPWIKELEQYCSKLPEGDTPVLGVCFGNQMLAQALGGEIQLMHDERGEIVRESGIIAVELTEMGKVDPLFHDVSDNFNIISSHRRKIARLPEGAEILASNQLVDAQSFKQGDNIRGIQPHPEITPEILEKVLRSRTTDPAELEIALTALKDKPPMAGKKILGNFIKRFRKGQKPR